MVKGRGRRTGGAALIEKFEGSRRAKEKFAAIIETLSGEKTVLQACEELGICETMFFKMRDQFFAEALPVLEPKKCGRKPRAEPDPEILKLQEENEELRKQLIGAETREQLLRLGLETPAKTDSKKKPAQMVRSKRHKHRQHVKKTDGAKRSAVGLTIALLLL